MDELFFFILSRIVSVLATVQISSLYFARSNTQTKPNEREIGLVERKRTHTLYTMRFFYIVSYALVIIVHASHAGLGRNAKSQDQERKCTTRITKHIRSTAVGRDEG